MAEEEKKAAEAQSAPAADQTAGEIQPDEDQVRATIERIRPYIQMDGGDIVFDHIKDGYVYVRMYGACMGCFAIGMTLNSGVSALLRDECPGVKGVYLIDPNTDEPINSNNLDTPEM